jgi:hypothetical protein
LCEDFLGNFLSLKPLMRVSDSSDPEEENSPLVPALFRIVRENPGKNVAQ